MGHEIEHAEEVRHMARCEPCRKRAWEKRGGHPVLNGTASQVRGQFAVATGRSTLSPKIDRFLETGDPTGV